MEEEEERMHFAGSGSGGGTRRGRAFSASFSNWRKLLGTSRVGGRGKKLGRSVKFHVAVVQGKNFVFL